MGSLTELCVAALARRSASGTGACLRLFEAAKGADVSVDTGKLVIRGAGLLIILTALGAALLPLAEELSARRMLAWLLLAGGVLELAAAIAMKSQRAMTAIAGGATLLAALRLLLDPGAGFFEILNLTILWLVVRSAALGYAAFRSIDGASTWTGLAAAIDFLLAVALLAGLPVAILVVGLFGPTRPISATFAWVIAINFLASAVRLFALSAPESESGHSAARD